MFEGISPSGWLVIACALGLGFGVVRFLIVTMNEKPRETAETHSHREDGASVQSTAASPADDAKPPVN